MQLLYRSFVKTAVARVYEINIIASHSRKQHNMAVHEMRRTLQRAALKAHDTVITFPLHRPQSSLELCGTGKGIDKMEFRLQRYSPLLQGIVQIVLGQVN